MPCRISRLPVPPVSASSADTGRFSARYVALNAWIPRSSAAWASNSTSAVARPTRRHVGSTTTATSATPPFIAPYRAIATPRPVRSSAAASANRRA
jgi:hypothetical protein